MTSAPETSSISMRTGLGYGVGALGSGVFNTVPSVLLLFYLTSIVGLPAALAGAAVLVPKIWIVLIDPFLGYWSDTAKTPWGRRKPFMLAGAILSAITFVVLFSLPEAPVVAAFLLVLVAYTVCSTANALFAVPYLSLPVEMTSDAHQRTRLMAFRMVFLLIGILLAGAVAPILVDHFGGGREGYAGMAIVMALIFGSAKLTAAIAVREGRTAPHKQQAHGLITQLKLAAKNRLFLILLTAFLIQSAGIGMFSATLPYYAQHRLGLGGDGVTVIFTSLAVTGMLVMPLWPRLSKRIGKIPAYTLSALIFAAGVALFLITPTTLQSDHVLVLVLLGAVAGVGFGGQQLLSFALLPDFIEKDYELTGLRREAAYAGVWSALEKVALGLGAMGAGAILQVFGYVSSAGEQTTQSESAVFGVLIAFAVAPAIVMVVSLWPLRALYAADRSDAATPQQKA